MYAFFIAITNNTTIEEIARVRGEKQFLVGWVDPNGTKAFEPTYRNQDYDRFIDKPELI